MRLLLDTHILIWLALEPARLGAGLAVVLERDDTEIWLSPITAWECHVLCERGRLALLPDPASWFRESAGHLGAREAPLNHEVALRSRSLGVPQQDPADRFLAATAAVYGLTLATADDKLLSGSGYQVLANR